ncbi:hypothetical protein FD737_06255 [Pantoea sp. Seng]|uniref:MrpH family fimbial adhesin n=1 Tax=Pantoea sp. Seng TaxID=2576761 RepID=UPI00132BCB87|nr:spore coat protein U domain-containing protein [Pantoea sp. Seng]MXP52683.1 hypothetical protein [Pantoea sp. Seng]
MKISYLFLSIIIYIIPLQARSIITISNANVPDGSFSVNISYSASGGNSTAAIGCGTRYCDFGIWVVNSTEARPARILLSTSGIGTDTWSNANTAFLRTYPSSANISSPLPLGPGPYSVCIGGAQNNLGYLYRNQPGTSCRPVSFPPVPTSCAFSSSPNIDHGTLQADKVNGKQDSVSINVNCNRATSANIASLGGAINMGGGVSSTLTFDGRGLGSIYLPNGISTHTVTSTLSATNPTPGDKSGSGAIVINLP